MSVRAAKPKAGRVQWLNSVENAMRSKVKPFWSPQCIIGVVIDSRLKIMLHWPHHGKGIHIAVEHKTIFGNWRSSIPDIEIKYLGKEFLKWIGK